MTDGTFYIFMQHWVRDDHPHLPSQYFSKYVPPIFMKKLPTIDERNDSVNEDLPNYDRSVHARGSLTNRHMLSQKRRANLNKMIKRITE